MATILDAVTMEADVTSNPVLCDAFAIQSLQIMTDNTDAVGLIYIQGSNDKSNWANLEFITGGSAVTSITVASGVNNNDTVDLEGYGSRWLRVFYDRTSGDDSNTITVIENHKMLSGR